MFQIIRTQDCAASPWKNGGGITREIARARHPRGGEYLWRISLADVASDGPFSRFAGLSRILTVVEGAGIDLIYASGDMPARLLQPVAFSGDLPILGQLVAGSIRDVNVIYDAGECRAEVQVLRQSCQLEDKLGQVLCIFALSGGVLVAGQSLPQGDFALGTGAEVALQTGALALLIQLQIIG